MKKQVRIIGNISIPQYNSARRQEILSRNGGKKLRMSKKRGDAWKETSVGPENLKKSRPKKNSWNEKMNHFGRIFFLLKVFMQIF